MGQPTNSISRDLINYMNFESLHVYDENALRELGHSFKCLVVDYILFGLVIIRWKSGLRKGGNLRFWKWRIGK